LYLSDVNFQSNRGTDGGGLGVLNTKFQMNNFQFSLNSASNTGGGFYEDDGSQGNLTLGVFTYNTASSGGAWTSDDSNGKVTNGYFYGNQANGQGGAILMTGVGSGLIGTSLLIDHNTAGGEGGGVQCYDATCNLVNSTFQSNSGSMGGGINVEAYATGYFQNVVFMNNQAVDGGALALQYQTTVQLLNCYIQNNTAMTGGGGIYCGDSNLQMDDFTNLGNNMAPQASDFFCSTTPSATYCQVSGNSAFTNYCPAPGNATLSSTLVAIIASVVVIGVVLIAFTIFMIWLLADADRRKKIGKLWNKMDDESQMTDQVDLPEKKEDEI